MHTPYHKTVKVRSGLLGVRFKRSTSFLRAGETIRIRAHHPHALVNPCDEDIQILLTTDASNHQLPLAFAIQRSLAKRGLLKPSGVAVNVVAQAILMQMTSSRYTGIRACLNPVMRCIAARAAVTGEAQQIIKRFNETITR